MYSVVSLGFQELQTRSRSAIGKVTAKYRDNTHTCKIYEVEDVRTRGIPKPARLKGSGRGRQRQRRCKEMTIKTFVLDTSKKKYLLQPCRSYVDGKVSLPGTSCYPYAGSANTCMYIQ